MKKLVLSGSSFLIPNHKAWAKLQSLYDLAYSEYGDWSGALIQSNPDSLVSITINLSEFIEFDSLNHDKSKDLIASILTPLINRLSSSNDATIVGICSGKDFQVVRDAKEINVKQKIYSQLLNQFEELALEFIDFYFIDLDHQFSRLGIDKAFDQRNWYLSHCHFSSHGLYQIAKYTEEILLRHTEPSYKVLVLDCDNTIWGGVVGEDDVGSLAIGQDGIGSAFVDFQKDLVKLSNQGVLLVLASKNNEAEVWKVFDNHPSMVLRREHIVAWRINWNEKSKNIIELSEELGLNINSFAFWDDNPLEREQMKVLLPDVLTIDIPENIWDWPKYLRELPCFSKLVSSSSDKNKIYQYKARAQFVQATKNVADMRSYLETINLSPSASNVNELTISRAVQLCQKTNQFNVRTERHTIAKIKNFSEDDKDFSFMVSLKDIYGDHGIVGLVCLKSIDKETIFIDTFLLSCRVLGRYLESWMLSEIIRRCQPKGTKNIIGEFIISGRNEAAQNFFEENDFKETEIKPELLKKFSSKGYLIKGITYSLQLASARIPNMNLFKDV
ncbi:MAG: HAD-IIIC family phosphatase [Flammeovirgaceae bacterium]|jgi:FkbH-like protein|nr:HAD-IIIC family phosphatase [Flammeovirgaceae bacterium]